MDNVVQDGKMDPDDGSQGADGGRVLAGLLVIAAGLVLLADRLGMDGIHLSGRYWPLLLIAFGAVRFLNPPAGRHGRRRSRRPGAWLMYVGAWGLVSEFHVLGFSYQTSWPLLLVGAGVGIIWRAFEAPGGRYCGRVRES